MKLQTIKVTVLTLFLLVSICMETKATAQTGEIIIIDGEEFEMLSLPMRGNLARSIEELDLDIFSSGCWRGYIGEWELENGLLYLNRILAPAGEIDVIPFTPAFDKYMENGRVRASWYSGQLRVVRGERIYYDHAEFDRYYEYETIYYLEDGIILDKKDYHNRTMYLPEDIPSITSAQSYYIQKAKGAFNRLQFPELADKEILYLNELQFTKEGTLSPKSVISVVITGSESEEDSRIEDPDHPYIQEWKRCLNTIPVWPVMVIHDEVDKWLYFGIRIQE